MKRREFLGASCLAGLAAAGERALAADAGEPPKRDFYELRAYRVEAGPMRTRLDEFLGGVAIPAWNRLGVDRVGAFADAEGKSPDVTVLLTWKTLEAFATAPQRLWADADYRKAGAALLDPAKADPLYTRIESSLLLAFEDLPHLGVPEKKEARVFQLRTYESYSDAKAWKKIEMFQAGGELAIFARAGMPPVFFGQSLAGAKLPNLTYMLCFDDQDARKAAWGKFLADPEWKKLSADPAYKDTVSAITNTFLLPTAYSQL